MPADIYSSFFIQMLLFGLLAAVLLISAVSLFIRPAKRTIRASLVDASNGHILDISQAETSIGRAKACDIVIPEITVSRFHAVLSKRKSGWMIFDTNSTAGVLVNDEPIEKKAFLHDGDTITFGKIQYVFYSTAVTTRQQAVPKTKKPIKNERMRYKKQKDAEQGGQLEYVKPKASSAGRKIDAATKKRRYDG